MSWPVMGGMSKPRKRKTAEQRQDILKAQKLAAKQRVASYIASAKKKNQRSDT